MSVTIRNWETLHSPDRLEFDLLGATGEDAKTLRLRILNLPTLALHDVRVHLNEGSVPDEILAHSVGLIPVMVRGGDVPMYNEYDRCVCRGARCKECSVRFTLYKTTPGRVYSHDFESSDPSVRLMRDIPLTDLTRPGTCLKLEAYTKQGAVEKDANVVDVKWQCATPAIFTRPWRVELLPGRNLTPAQKRDLVACCPAKVFQVLGDMEDMMMMVAINPEAKCMGCKECVRKAEDFKDAEDDPPLVSVAPDKSVFHFWVEMAGQLSAETVKREIKYKYPL